MRRRYLRFWGTDVRADVDAELAFHVDELVDRLVREGRDPAEARAEAARRFGDYAAVHGPRASTSTGGGSGSGAGGSSSRTSGRTFAWASVRSRGAPRSRSPGSSSSVSASAR